MPLCAAIPLAVAGALGLLVGLYLLIGWIYLRMRAIAEERQ